MDHSHQDMHAAAAPDIDAVSGHRCQMSMLFTWNTQDLCLVFRWWHVTSTLSLVLSLLAVVALGVGYEFLRELSRRYEARVDADALQAAAGEEGDGDDEERSLLPGLRRHNNSPSSRRAHVVKGLFYGAQVFYSFFIMLLFMTYNGWVMIAVSVGAFVGYVLWGGGNESATKSVACH